MASRWEHLQVRSHARIELIDITDRVTAALPERAEGALVLFVPHTTAALLLNEHEENLLGDVHTWLERAVPADAPYAHNRIDDNAAAHLRTTMLGSSLVVPVEEGRPALGRWQRIFLVELDGPRTRQVRFRLLG